MASIIVDITRSSSEAKSIVGLLGARNDVPPNLVTVVCGAPQIQKLQALGMPIVVRTVASPDDDLAVREEMWSALDSVLKADGAERISVYSTRESVSGLSGRLTSPALQNVEFVRWSSEPSQGKWPQALGSLEEALEILKLAIIKKLADNSTKTGLKSTDVRPALISVDRRFTKGQPFANTKGLMTMLIDAARQHPEFVVDGKGTQTTVKLRANATHGGSQEVSGASKISPPTRSGRFVEALSSAGLGPFARVRLLLYASLLEMLKESSVPTHTVLTLTMQAVSRTRTKVGKQPPFDKYPWRKVHQFLINVITLEPVLIGAAGPIKIKFSALSERVGDIQTGFESKLDGVLILALVKKFPDIGLADLPSLAGALYLNRDDPDYERVSTVVQDLMSRGMIRESDNHTLEVISTASESSTIN